MTGRWKYLNQKNGSWEDIEIPSSWTGYSGKVLFRRSFKIDSLSADKQLRLVILDFAHRCSIKLNGEFVSTIEGPRHELDLPPKLLQYDDNNILEIEVDNSLDPLNTIPVLSGKIRPANYGGITGDIFIVCEKLPFLSCLGMETSISDDGKKGYISAEVEIVKSPIQELSGFIVWRILNEKGDQVLIDRKTVVSLDSVALRTEIPSPDIWGPSSPKLYTVQCWLESENYQSSVRNYKTGFRKFSAAGELKLNGKNIRIQGVSYRSNHIYGDTFTDSDYTRDVELIRMSGANAVLLPDPVHPYFLQLCDNAGLLVFQSTAIEGVPNSVLKRTIFRNTAAEKIRNLVRYNSYHPSIVSWVAGLYLEPMPELGFVSDDNLLQDDRPIFYGLTGKPPEMKLLDSGGKSQKNPTIVYGIGSTLTDDSEKSQSLQLSNLANDLNRWKNADAIFICSFSDWKTDRRTLFQISKDSRNLNLTGLLRWDRSERLAYRTLQSGWFSLHPTKVIPATESDPLSFSIMGFILLTLIFLYIRSNNVFKVQLVRIFAHPHGFYQDIRNRRFIQRMQTTVVGLSSVMVLTLISSSLIYKLRFSESLDYIFGHLFQGSALENTLIAVAHNPKLAILYFFIVIFAGFISTAVLFKISSLFLKQSVTLGQSFSYTFWCNASYIWLAPVTVFFYKGLSIRLLAGGEIIVLILFVIWVYFRLLNALRVGCSTTYPRAFLTFTLLHLLELGIILMYFQYKCAIFQYFGYFVKAVL